MHVAFLSSKEDESSAVYRGRASHTDFVKQFPMMENEWKPRLRRLVDESGLSMRQISLRANLGPGYLHSVLVEGKDPTIGRLLAVCNALNCSASYILYGVDVTPAQEKLLRYMQDHPERAAAILALISDPDQI